MPVEASGKLVTLHSFGFFPPLGPKSLGMYYARHQGNQASRCNRISDSTEDQRLVEKLGSNSTWDQQLAHREKRIARKTRTTLRAYRACQWRPRASSTLCDLGLFPPHKSLGTRLKAMMVVSSAVTGSGRGLIDPYRPDGFTHLLT